MLIDFDRTLRVDPTTRCELTASIPKNSREFLFRAVLANRQLATACPNSRESVCSAGRPWCTPETQATGCSPLGVGRLDTKHIAKEEKPMIDATLLMKDSTVFSPWMPRGGDNLRATL